MKLLMATIALLSVAGSAQAKEAVAVGGRGPAVAAQPVVPPEAIAIAVQDGQGVVWSGALRIGGPYGNASFSQSRSEFAEPCSGEGRPDTSYATASTQLSFSISRYNSQAEPDRFSINVNWSKPIAACQGEGNDSYGFNRTVTILRGQTATVEGSGGVSVKLTRPR